MAVGFEGVVFTANFEFPLLVLLPVSIIFVLLVFLLLIPMLLIVLLALFLLLLLLLVEVLFPTLKLGFVNPKCGRGIW